jgi:hypothetical protein
MAFKNPGSEFALTRDDVAPGVAYVTYEPGLRVIQRGIFLTEAQYGEGEAGWTALAKVEGAAHGAFEQTVILHQAGITQDYDNEGWSRIVTIAETEWPS